MEQKILVSLVSDQTIPNVELIKEFKGQVDKYLFLKTGQMKNQLQWITKAANLEQSDFETIEIDPFDADGIEQQLKKYNFGDDEIILNITGGTKLMSIIVNDFFRDISATIYYVTGHNKQYLKLYPNRGNKNFTLTQKLTLKEYLTAYGFEYDETQTYKDFPVAARIFNYYTKSSKENILKIFEPIRLRRGRNMNIENPETEDFIQSVNYPTNNGKLNKKDTKYLSGDWFEEYVYYRIKEELKLDDSEIATGINLKKEGAPNEIDVIFIYNHKLYIIECKTSIFDKRNIKRLREGKEVEEVKDINLLPEIIYKSDALRSKFGLFANTSIFTLEEIKKENGAPINNFTVHFERAELSRILIVSKKDITLKKSLKKELKIK